MHFSEVGSGKTKVIMPLLCQIFLSNNVEAHKYLARSGKLKDVLVILVPEHLVPDARTQVFRYCLNLNFREEYRVHDDIFALMHNNVNAWHYETDLCDVVQSVQKGSHIRLDLSKGVFASRTYPCDCR